MEILLLQDVPNVGKRNDLLVVGDGYALNYLLPNRLAIVATPTVRKRFAESIRTRAMERENEKKVQAGAAQALAGKSVKFVKKVTKTGRLYGAITEKTIADALKQQLSMSVAHDHIEIDQPIKSVGSFTVSVRMGENVGKLQVIVEAEQEEK